jgi:hypothetical protein
VAAAAAQTRTKGDNAAAPPQHAITSNNGVLPSDMLREVLLRLPPLVCQSWRYLTSDPIFAKEHSPRHDRYFVAILLKPREIHILDLDGTIIKRIPMVDPKFLHV